MRDRRMTTVREFALLVTVVLMPVAASAAIDLGVTGSVAPNPAEVGEAVTFTFTVANTGGTAPVNVVILDARTPPNVPIAFADYLAGDPTAIGVLDAMCASVQMSSNLIGASTGVYCGEDSWCEGFLIQPQDIELPAGTSGDVTFSLTVPDAPTVRPAVSVSSATLNGEMVFGRGGCSSTLDCNDASTPIPCLGPRLTAIDTLTAQAQLVSDGTGSPTLGCSPLVGFTAGRVAVIDRGTCAFENKILNAVNAGASAVLILNNNVANPPTPDAIINMACTNYCNSTTINIPTASVSYNNGVAIKTALAAGPLYVTMGLVYNDDVHEVPALVWESATTAEDTNQANNSTTVDLTVDIVDPNFIFSSGFEQGNYTGWSAVTP